MTIQQTMKLNTMKLKKNKLQQCAVIFSILLLSACGTTATKPSVKEPVAPTTTTPDTTAKPGVGGYYLDDGPGEGAPADIDSIPDAQITNEPPMERSNKAYSALGKQYSPMTSYKPYKKQGIASWYGKRYHGKQTSSGEVYDMYGMTAAHTTLPLPSYAKVTNPANGRSVIVRINDRGPFKNDRLVDLSYAAAYKLRLIDQGSGLVELELIDSSSKEAVLAATRKAPPQIETASVAMPTKPSTTPPAAAPQAITTPVEIEPAVTTTTPELKAVPPPVKTVAVTPPAKISTPPAINKPETSATSFAKPGYYVQAGAFGSEANGLAMQKKIQRLPLAENVSVTNVYNNGLYQVKLGPYASKKEADASAGNLRKQLNIVPIVKKQ
ncbi:MAG: septal ring lytic transglycosylase RlpA family protein [Methylotenera sp.]